MGSLVGVALLALSAGPQVVLVPVTTLEKQSRTVLHRVIVRVPCTQTVLVTDTRHEKQLRLVYRRVERRVTEPALMPVTVRRKCTQMVLEQLPEVRIPTPVLVAHTRDEWQMRTVYRSFPGKVPVTRLVYVPVTRSEKRWRMVYVEEEVKVKRLASEVRPAQDGTTCPGCTQREVTETVRVPVLRPREFTENITDYQLRPRKETVEDVRPVSERVRVPVTTYRVEVRRLPAEPRYVLRPRTREETHTTYRLVPHTRTVEEFVPAWEMVSVPVTTYRLERRVTTQEQERFVACVEEVVVPVTRWSVVRP
jgi:hypothetical protein